MQSPPTACACACCSCFATTNSCFHHFRMTNAFITVLSQQLSFRITRQRPLRHDLLYAACEVIGFICSSFGKPPREHASAPASFPSVFDSVGSCASPQDQIFRISDESSLICRLSSPKAPCCTLQRARCQRNGAKLMFLTLALLEQGHGLRYIRVLLHQAGLGHKRVACNA